MPTLRKTDSLRAEGTLNPHADAVADPLFHGGDFFDAEDIVQVRYEMLRRVRVDAQSVTRTATDFGVSRPTFYEAQAAFEHGGVSALVPKKRGPHGPHKLADEVLAFVRTEATPGGPLRAPELARKIEARFGLLVHPRTIERALNVKKKP